MKPTEEQRQLIKFFKMKLDDLETVDVSSVNESVEDHIAKIDKELKHKGILDEHYAAEALRDLVLTIINNP